VIQKIKLEKSGDFESRYLIYSDSSCENLVRITFSRGTYDFSTLTPENTENPHHYIEILQDNIITISKSDQLDRIEKKVQPMKCPKANESDRKLFGTESYCYNIDLPRNLAHSNYIGIELGSDQKELFLRHNIFPDTPNTGLNQPSCYMNPAQNFSDFLKITEAIDRSNTSGTFCYRFEKF
jgi:hypothetical protein